MEARIQNALISVFDKSGLAPIIQELSRLGIKMYSTGGTADFIADLGAQVFQVEDLTGYPSILDGRVKTLHPKVFGASWPEEKMHTFLNSINLKYQPLTW